MLTALRRAATGFIVLSLVPTARAHDSAAPEISATSREELKETLSLDRGIFTVESKWTTAPQTAGETDVLFGKVSFRAKPSHAGGTCQNISFIQTARILNNQGTDYQWPMGQDVRNRLRTKSGVRDIEPGFFIDHDAVNCTNSGNGCSPFFRDHWPNIDSGSRDGSLSTTKSTAAVLIDFPYGWELITSAALETCAVCRETNENFGCVTWGGTWPLTGERVLHPITSANTPSKTFSKALSLFNSFYNKE